jgi:predicted transcriptional regulator
MTANDNPPTVNDSRQQADLVSLASEVVSAYVANNSLTRTELPALIAVVHGALSGLGRPTTQEPERPAPPIPIKKSITSDYLISLEDGKQYKALKRHLTRLGLTPEQYRAKWGLPPGYPMVAPNYAKRRSEIASKMGLGQKRTGKKGARKGGARKPSSE